MLFIVSGEANPRGADGKAFFGKILFIFGHDIIGILFTFVEISGLPKDLQTTCLELLQTEIKEPYIVGLEFQNAAFSQQTVINGKEGAVGQAALGVSRFGPGIAEIQINAVY